MALFGGKKKETVSQPATIVSKAPLFTTRRGGDTTLTIDSLNSWQGLQYGLGDASIAIAIDDSFRPTREDIYSIPDVFAEVRAMSAALEDDDSPLHGSALADWRAVMTVLLLHKELNISVETLEIDFGALSEYDAMFLHAAAEYLPKEYDGKLIIYQTRSDLNELIPFALSSPDFFVCPAKEIRAKLLIPSEIADFDDAKTILKDPSPFLHSASALGYRITEVLTEALQKRMVRKARHLIEAFIKSVGVAKQPDERLAFGRALIGEWAELDCFGKSGDVLAAEDIFTEEICLFNTSELKADGSKASLPYDDRFSSGLADYRVYGRDDEPLHYALLPLREDFLSKYAYADDGQPNTEVFQKIRMSGKKDGNSSSIEVKLLFKGITYAYSYDESKWIEPSAKKRTLPPISVWPNRKDDAGKWSAYYTFIGTQFDEDADAYDWTGLNFCALICNGDLRETVGGKQFTEKRNVAVKQYTDCKYEIIQTVTFPHVLLAHLDNGAGDTGKYVGAFVMNSGGESVNPVSDRKAVIGIDFGTSNTIAFYALSSGSDDNMEPQPIDFKKANVQPAIANDVFDKMSSRFFLSSRELTGDVSFPTILHVSDKSNNATSELFSGANIYFRGNEGKDKSNVDIMKVPNLETDIKWATDAAKRVWTQKFVTQLCVFCAWQAVLKTRAGILEWRFSFPSSISNAVEFTDALKNAADTAARIVFGENVRDTARPDLTSESHAAGLYFMYNKNPEVDSEDGFISIDIGGGSTDISIWQHEQNRAKAEASVKFAGRDILTNTALSLCDDDIYLRKLWTQMGVSDIVLREVSGTIEGTDISKAILFDTMLAYAKNQLISSLGIYNGQKPLSNVIKLVTFNLAMLVALAGTMLRELLANDLFTLHKKLTIVFCGNGSKTRDWLKAEDKEALLARVLREVAGKDLTDTKIKFVTINNPKEVVAAGLVSVKNLRRSDETFNAADYASDVLAQKVVIHGDGVRNESSKAEVLALFDKLYEILSSDDLSFKLNGYKSFRTKEDFMSKMNAAFSALDPVGSGYDRITFAYAFVRCAQVANTMLIADMKNDM